MFCPNRTVKVRAEGSWLASLDVVVHIIIFCNLSF